MAASIGQNNESKCLSAGSEKPKVDQKDLTVFSMRLCPYAERVRLILNDKQVPYKVINIDLEKKPQWYFELNPLGKVPAIMEGSRDPLFESLICAEYLDEKYPGKKLLPSEPYEKARQKIIIEVVAQKFVSPVYAVILKNDGNDAIQKGMDEVEKMLTTKYFAGDSMSFVDLMVWPWFERLPSLQDWKNVDFSKQRYPKLNAWFEAMMAEPSVKEVSYPKEIHTKFYEGYAKGIKDFDIGL